MHFKTVLFYTDLKMFMYYLNDKIFLAIMS